MTSEIKYLDNIKNYQPTYFNNNSTTSVWHKLPIARRSAVLVLLFMGKYGELRVILTKRSRNLRNFSGHISFPGGKADNGLESEWETARRESFEEIGLPLNNEQLGLMGLQIEKLATLPCFLARTLLAVRPCVGILKSSDLSDGSSDYNILNKALKLALNPGESSSVFSVPLREFFDQRKARKIANSDELQPKPKELVDKKTISTNWAGIKWQYRSFLFPATNEQHEVDWLNEIDDLSSDDGESFSINDKQSSLNQAREEAVKQPEQTSVPVRNVWGLTANILHELALITYEGSLYWNDKAAIGEEELLYSLSVKGGQLQSGKRSDFEVKIINGDKKTSFGDTLPVEEFDRLTKIYNTNAKI